jgi:glycosyltransferase involved in cell wall biosynthesis
MSNRAACARQTGLDGKALKQEIAGDAVVVGEPMRVLIVTDAWYPQINGVVRSIERMTEAAASSGAEVTLLTPEDFRSVPLPTYPEIRLALARPGRLARMIARLAPTHIHIATEGPLGILTRRLCVRHGLPFTTCFHTRLPDYVRLRMPIPIDWTWWLMRRFHNAGSGVMVDTDSLARELAERGFTNIVPWRRGVDTELFHPTRRTALGCAGPVFLYVGRLAIEKSVDDFLGLDLPGTKVVVGDGPARRQLEAAFPQASFLGTLTGKELARAYASADVFVFPSRTDTFGMVLLEALASGLPIAAFPTAGPLAIVGASGCGRLGQDLRRAALEALEIPRERCRARAMEFSWATSAALFFANIRAGNRGMTIDASVLDRPRLVERARRRLGWRPATVSPGT